MHSVCGVIVTYHPDAKMIGNMTKVLEQVQGLVVVDNGSSDEKLNSLRTASRDLGFHLIENGENLGIADALNQGVRWAKNEGYPLVILFDQDSQITDGFVGQMFTSWESHPQRERVGSIHPRYVHLETGLEKRVRRAGDGGPIISITSGALMPTWIFEQIGWFASEYFIDEVDSEYCYRIRASGYLVADSREAKLLHVAGHPKEFSFLGFHFRPGHHSALRRYYMSRNRVALCRKYFRIFPMWLLLFAYDASYETIKCFIVEDERRRKFRNLLVGTWDGLTGRMGKREGL
jgi:rhamnosyltransferase